MRAICIIPLICPSSVRPCLSSHVMRRSGYGLDVDNERKMLQVARQIGEQRDIRVVKTFLGAHAVPAEFTDDAVSISAELRPQGFLLVGSGR